MCFHAAKRASSASAHRGADAAGEPAERPAGARTPALVPRCTLRQSARLHQDPAGPRLSGTQASEAQLQHADGRGGQSLHTALSAGLPVTSNLFTEKFTHSKNPG